MKIKTAVILTAALFICACHSTKNDTQSVRQNLVSALQKQYVSDNLEPYSEYRVGPCDALFADLNSPEIDIRYCDVSKVDFTKLSGNILDKLSFNSNKSKTVFPDKMPAWFDLKKINKIGKTPGLNVKELHKEGITGKGVTVAIIDQALSSHREYKDNVVFYKNFTRQKEGSMHGAAVSSIAIGKNIGVAPEANLIFIAGEFVVDKQGTFDAGLIAKALDYLLELNKTLPKENKITVVSISRGFSPMDKDIEKFEKAKKEALKQNVLVLTTNEVNTISRKGYLADTDDLKSYTIPPYWFADKDMSFIERSEDIFIPTDYRITAAETGENDYAYYNTGGLSWAVPYLAGVAALAKQVKPNLKAEEFIPLARKTADTVTVKDSKGKEYKTKYFINPTRLINELQGK